MRTRPQGEGRKMGPNFFRLALASFSLALLLAVVGPGAHAQDKEPHRLTRPARILNIQGQVSLPEGMPAGRSIVTLITSAGVPRQTYTNEQGRYEFSGIEEGGYTLTARSLSDFRLVSDRVETDTSRTATGELSVNLILHKESSVEGARSSAEVITVAEADQNVPKEARKAFKAGLKFRTDNEPDKALGSFSRAVELYPNYFQALTERGDLEIFQHRLDEAASDFERALKINPRYGRALRGAGYCRLEKREFAEAINYLEKAITAQPDIANNYLLLGIAYLELDQRRPARMALLKALSFNSAHELRAHIYLGNLYARERQYKAAADQLQKYLEANPKAADAPLLRSVESQWRALAAAETATASP